MEYCRVIYKNELYHHGIKGMKWGVRRYQNKNGGLTAAGIKRYGNDIRKDYAVKKKARNAKIEKLEKSKSVQQSSDYKRIQYAKKSVAGRHGEEFRRSLTGHMVKSVLTGDLKRYSTMDKKQLATELGEVVLSAGKEATINTAKNSLLAESALRKYNDNGRRKKGQKPLSKEWMTREDKMEIAMMTAPYIKTIAKLKVGDANRKAAVNKAKFEAWGGNILEAKFDDIVGIRDNEWRVVK